MKRLNTDFSWKDVEAVQPGYWLLVADGLKAVEYLLALDSLDAIEEAIESQPILFLPAFIVSLERLSQQQAPETTQAILERAAFLRQVHKKFTPRRPMPFAAAMANLAYALIEETRGARSLNLQVIG